MKITEDYVFFWRGPFSQWAKSKFMENNLTFHTAEHYMMYHKALILKDEDAAARVLMSYSPKIAKTIGRSIPASKEDLKHWDDVKFDIVFQGNLLKFSQNKDMRDKLLRYYPRRFVEASPYDTVWGIGMTEDHPDAANPYKWQGKNLLGKVLDKVADRLYGTDI